MTYRVRDPLVYQVRLSLLWKECCKCAREGLVETPRLVS
jgi:hypothetical protein